MEPQIRVASFNASLNRSNAGELITDLSTPDNAQAQAVAEIIQRSNPDVVLVNEFDFDADGTAADLFRTNYLEVGQNGVDPVEYPFVYVAPSNTGLQSGFDLDNSGTVGDGPNDAFGFGFFEGQFAFVIYSKFPILEDEVRTFQEFRWADMPDALLFDVTEGERPLFDPERPFDPANPDDPNTSFYTEEEAAAVRLSAKNHVDLPVVVDGEVVHILAAHPTPPVFDGVEDRNGKLNSDEIRFWNDYVQGADYIYDDQGRTGGLDQGERFVIVGDYNADPFDGDSRNGAANQFFDNPLILGSTTDASITPAGPGGAEQAVLQGALNDTNIGNPAFDTADFGPDTTVANLRVDYALPSVAGFDYVDGAVFWPETTDPTFDLVGTFPFPSSDHRLVQVDLAITEDGTRDDPNRTIVEGTGFAGLVEIPSGTEFEGTVLGGLSGLVRNPVTGTYLAVSDDRGLEDDTGAPTSSPRVYELAIDLSDGSLDEGDVTILGVLTLTDADGNVLNDLNPDLEGIAFGPAGELVISSERDADGNPALYFFDAETGQLTDTVLPDAKFLPVEDADGTRISGVINNLGFESLTVTPNEERLFTATEGGLVQDGGRATFDTPAYPRVIEYDAETLEPIAEYIYEVDRIAVPTEGFADSGLVELIAIDNEGTFLALERSFSLPETATIDDRGYTGKIYLTSIQGATDVSGVDAIPFDEDGEPLVDELMRKDLLVDLGVFGIEPDNIEALALGPQNADGTVPLIVMSDDNFSAFGPQANQFIAINLDLGTVPTITPDLETPSELRYPGPTPLVIAHRGFSADRPEHTLEAYQLAIDAGADFIEPDLVSTSDGVLIARHEPWLATVETDEDGNVVLDDNGDPVITFASTDVATRPEFADRLTTKDIGFSSDGLFGSVTGWFAEDFTLEEIKTLRAVEDEPDVRPQSAEFDGQFEIPTLEEIIQLVQEVEADTGQIVGIYPETKEPSYFDAIGLSLEEPLIQTLVDTGFTDPDRVFIQSFEVANLLDLQETVMPAAGVDLPLVQLLFNAPTFPTFDIFQAQAAGDLSAYASLPLITETTVSGDFLTPEGLAALAESYAEGVGPTLSLIFNDDTTQTTLVEDAQAADLLVHAYTHRDESLGAGSEGLDLTAEENYARFLSSGVDGLFTDNPDTGRAVTDELFVEEGPDPDDPAIYLHPTDPNQSLVVTSMKNGGLRVYDLAGEEISRIEQDGIRYNNVDVIYDIIVGDLVTEPSDLIVASDRANDTLAFFQIDPDAGTLTEISGGELSLISVPETIFGVDDGEATAYGLATYTSLEDGTEYIFVTQADGNQIAQLALNPDGLGGFNAEIVRTIELPVPEGEDPADFQSEGIAVDRELGRVYVSVEEELGLVAFGAEPTDGTGVQIVAPIDADFFTPDLEGVSIHYGENGTGAILVSSQGDATFAAFDRLTNDYLGSFAIRDDEEAGLDGVQESDGLDIFSAPLGDAFPNGLLVTQDGNNEPVNVFPDPEDGEIQNFDVNFKYTDLGKVADLVGIPGNATFDPRNIEAAEARIERIDVTLGQEQTVDAETVGFDAALVATRFRPVDDGFAVRLADDTAETTAVDPTTLDYNDFTLLPVMDDLADCLARIYEVAFGRLYDVLGLNYWYGEVVSGFFSKEALGSIFADSLEFEVRNGADLGNADFVDTLIENAFGEESVDVGRDTLVADLDAGTATRGEVVLSIAEDDDTIAFFDNLTDDGVLLLDV
ncbi:MAG: phytase [Paracoccaceae bacterium]